MLTPTVLFIVAVATVLFVAPKSLTLSYDGVYSDVGTELILWRWERGILAVVCAMYILAVLRKLKLAKSEALALAVSSLGVALNLINGTFEAVYGLVGSVAALGFVSLAKRGRLLVHGWVRNCVLASVTIYALQYAVYRLHGRSVASFLDANISGYYLFLACILMRAAGFRLLYLLAIVLGCLSYSRNYVLSILTFELLLLALTRFPRAFARWRHPNAFFIAGSLALIIATGAAFAAFVPEVQASTGGAERMYTLGDESNAKRFAANTHFLAAMSRGEYIVFGSGARVDDPEVNRPHNAFFRAIYRYGLVCSIGLFLIFARIADYFFRWSQLHRAAIISSYFYFSLLNDFITGPELAVFTVVMYSAGCCVVLMTPRPRQLVFSNRPGCR